jgi:hypothetical protein
MRGIAQDVLARGPRSVDARIGDVVPLAFDLRAVHLFDAATLHRIPGKDVRWETPPH